MAYQHRLKPLIEAQPLDTQGIKIKIIEAGVSKRVLQYMLANPYYRISGPHCRIICDVLGCSIRDLYPDVRPTLARELGLSKP